MITGRELERNLRLVERRIHIACEHAGRDPKSVQLVAATKTQPLELLRELYELGHRDFGENRVQELIRRKDELPSDVRWHFIGHLQSNKARQIASFIALVHSIDTFETARELGKRALQHERVVPVLVEVNVSREESKEGVESGDAEILVEHLWEECPGVEAHGLMGMASYEEEPERTRPQFAALRELRDRIQERHPDRNTFRELSMGMTNDFEIAIEEGATIVRIGSALFGERTY